MPVSHSISIHALRGEGDPHTGCCLPTSPQISIHALRGEGDEVDKRAYHKNKAFQSTPSVGRATPAPRYRAATGIHISIHALRGEGDQLNISICRLRQHFNPRPPWGGRRLYRFQGQQTQVDFNPRPPWGGRQTFSEDYVHDLRFQSTPSVGRATRVG